MSTQLRPMTLGEILDRTFQIYRSRLPIFIGIAALPALAMMAIHFIDSEWLHVGFRVRPYRRNDIVLWSLAVGLGSYHISSFFALMMSPAYVKQVASQIDDQTCSLSESIEFVLLRWRSYLWLAVLKVLAVLVIPESVTLGLLAGMTLTFNAIGGLDGTPGILASLVVCLACIAGVALFAWLGASLAFALPIAAIEGSSGVAALRRSWRLTSGSRGRIFVAWLVFSIVSMMAGFILDLLVRIVFEVSFHARHMPAWAFSSYSQWRYMVSTVLSLLLGSLYPITATLIYYDQRIRREGYDIESMMHVAGMDMPQLAVMHASTLGLTSTTEDAQS